VAVGKASVDTSEDDIDGFEEEGTCDALGSTEGLSPAEEDIVLKGVVYLIELDQGTAR
jgi:hypothetical protein